MMDNTAQDNDTTYRRQQLVGYEKMKENEDGGFL